MREWMRLAADPRVIRRALMYAVIVGAILISINHGDAVLRGDIGPGRALRMGLTIMVPYIVSTLSSVAALRSLRVPTSSSEQRDPQLPAH